jgi:capsular exopolysaccharide synthesis family protein
VDFRTFVRIITTRWKVVAAAVVACLAGAIAITAVQTKSYEASATVAVSFPGVVTVNEAYEATQAAQQRLSSYAELAGGRTVAQRAIDQLGAPLSAEELVHNTEVSYTPESTLFKLAVTDPDPNRAAALAAAMAGQFAALVPEVDTGVASSSPSVPAVGAGADNRQTPTSAQATVVEPPAVPEEAVSPVPARNVGLGLVAGVLLGIALAIVRDATDRTLRTRDSITASTGLPTLAQLPPPSAQDTASRRRATPSDLVFDEAVRGLRTRLLGSSATQPQSFLVSAPGLGQGATTTALNLALSFAAVEEAVLLIEGDPRQPTIAGLLGVESKLGLADILAEEQSLDDAVQPTAHPGLWVLASSEPTRIRRGAGSAALASTLQKLIANFDRVVIDGPPSFVAADAGVLASAVDATVVVVRAGVTTVDELDGAVQNLCATGANIVGAVLTDAAVPRRTKAAIVAYREKVGDTSSISLRTSRA